MALGIRCSEALENHRVFGGTVRVWSEGMASLNMQSLIHWFTTNGGILAVVLTVGVAVLLVCCVGCCDCPCRDKDDLFRRHV